MNNELQHGRVGLKNRGSKRRLYPSLKYSIAATLYRAHPGSLWEYEVYELLKPRYEPASLYPLRDELVGLATIGWAVVADEREVDGRLIRKYALRAGMLPFLRYQLNLPHIFAFLDS